MLNYQRVLHWHLVGMRLALHTALAALAALARAEGEEGQSQGPLMRLPQNVHGLGGLGKTTEI